MRVFSVDQRLFVLLRLVTCSMLTAVLMEEMMSVLRLRKTNANNVLRRVFPAIVKGGPGSWQLWSPCQENHVTSAARFQGAEVQG